MGKNGIKRMISALVSLLLIFTQIVSVTGCDGKKKGKVKKVSADLPWFTTTTTEIDSKYKKDKNIDWHGSEILGVYKDGILLYTEGTYASGGNFCFFDYYTFNGELIKSIDVSKELENKQIEDVIFSKDGIKLRLFNQLYPRDVKEKWYYTAELDLENGVLGELELLESIPNAVYENDDTRYEKTYIIGDYSVTRFEKGLSTSFEISKDGKTKLVDLSTIKAFSNIIIGDYIVVSEKEILFVCWSANVKFLSLNLETGEVKDKDEEYDWLNMLEYSTRITSVDGKTYITDQSGVKRINLEKKEFEEAFSFNSCNVNRYIFGRLRLLSAEDGRYVLTGSINHSDSLDLDFYSSSEDVPTIVVIEKADKNPNAGKIIITAAAAGDTYLSYEICEAIRIFNDTNEKYLIQIDSKLRFSDFVDYGNTDDDEERSRNFYIGVSQLGGQLAADILSGNGPDVILNAGDFDILQSEDYLVDLYSYINGKNGINEADYFSNVINAVKTNDKIFYMPTGFSLEGISTNRSNVRDDQIGFTFDEYAKFVHDVCNGSDPMNASQIKVFCTLFSLMDDTCIKGKEANFDNKEFRDLCEYVKNNVIYDPDKEYDEDAGAKYSYYSSIGSVLQIERHKASTQTLLGYPSPDSRGPEISISSSIGISACAPSAVADGVWEFIKFCLSDDIQDMVARSGYNPVSISVYESTARIAFESCNKLIIKENNWLNRSMPLVDESVIESYKKILLSGSVIENTDPAIIVVLREEMPPYFVDQKSLDEIIPIIKNRVTTILSERAS